MDMICTCTCTYMHVHVYVLFTLIKSFALVPIIALSFLAGLALLLLITISTLLQSSYWTSPYNVDAT